MKKQTKTARKRKPNKIIKALRQAINEARTDAAALDTCALGPAASSQAMGLAEMAHRIATGGEPNAKGSKVTPQERIAEALDSALRVARAQAELSGIKHGKAEVRQAMVEGVMSRITMNSLMSKRPVTIVLSFTEALAVRDVLAAAGHSDGVPRAVKQAWQMVPSDDDLHASLKAV